IRDLANFRCTRDRRVQAIVAATVVSRALCGDVWLVKNIDSNSHVRGESVYLDDIPLVEGTLYACVFDSPVAHGKLKSMDTKEAESSDGVVRVITAKDLVGENQIGGIVPDEPLL